MSKLPAAPLFILPVLACLAAWAQERPKAPEARLHPFIQEALASPHATRTNFFVAADGRIVRSTVYLAKEGLPDWVHEMASEKLGKGEDLAYEVEVYPDGSEVYEVYRKIGGKEQQLSVRPDKTVYYIGTEHAEDALPAAVSTALGGHKGFVVRRCIAKEGPTFFEYHVKGRMKGHAYRARISKDGAMIALQRVLPSEIELETSLPAAK